ncbi:MAG TPA: heat-inducible transcriptional repressor HrcA [Bellilinea sp.]|jgi:heat-inducible transcriptional repressor|nr:heat-inducible transcriptional repressor HrcA [Bellilinea sp.]
MQELSERQKLILSLVIHEYIRTATPVGSNALVARYHLEMSSATVRNEMAFLTELGYLRQPHTSAGRIPSEEGYRFFVSRLIRDADLPDTNRRTISHQFFQMRNDVEQWVRLAASVLAHQSRAASLVTPPRPERARIKHLELISTRGRQVLLVAVLVGGEVRQRFFTLSEPVPQTILSQSAERLSQYLQNADVDDIRARRSQFAGVDVDVAEILIEDLSHIDYSQPGEVIIDGVTNVLSEPEFTGSEDALRAVRILEQRSVLQSLVARNNETASQGGVQVLIGGEGNFDELRQWSIVLGSYGMPGFATGTLGVLGPMRMSYGRAISTVRFLSSVLSDLVADTLIEDASFPTGDVSL